jgi:membrane protease YdiL (CAAX protease family)
VVLITFFGGLAALAAMQQGSAAGSVTMKPEQVLPSSLLLLAVVAGVAGFLSFRGLRLREQFGMSASQVPRGLLWAVLLLPAALPAIAATGMLSQMLLGGSAVEQELVQLFREVVARADQSTIWQLVFAGAIAAPVTEEFLFRGYFYGIGKRYFGAVASGLLTAVLFAACHANLAALPVLFVLALCLTLAYELTGSLWVPMGMHALFNSANLAMLYHQASQPVP